MEIIIVVAILLALFLIFRWRRRRSSPLVEAEIEGEVRGFRERNESPGGLHPPRMVWTFRVEQHDPSGQVEVTPIQMQGKSFTGALEDGQQVRVPGRVTPGHTLLTRRVYNVDTQVWVGSKGSVGPIVWPYVIFFGIIGVIIFFAWLSDQ